MPVDSSRVFLIDDDTGDLKPLRATVFAQEDVLQAALERFPDVLPGDQINPEAPRRWLLVKREMPVPDEADGAGRWSLDHLFLDQDGIPTFVECKRSTDTRGRREVVAQMLDYAANGTEYWGADRLRQSASETHGDALDQRVRELLGLGPEDDLEDFWHRVDDNLKGGRVRLLFVADEVPRELRRLVEFLNAKLADVEVLAIELKQYAAGGRQRVLVPRVLGFSEAARDIKPRQSGPLIDRKSFLAQFDQPIRTLFEQIVNDAQSHGLIVYWGVKGFSVRTRLPGRDGLLSFAYGYPGGVVSSRPEPVFQVYRKYLDDAGVETSGLWTELQALDTIQPSSKGRFDYLLTEATIPQTLAAWRITLAFVDRLTDVAEMTPTPISQYASLISAKPESER